MQKERGKDAIRLTNRTAIALRKSARLVQKLYFAAAAVLTMLLTALAVYLGLKWLIAVPIVVVIAVLLDAVMLTLARSRYLALTGQAICTEAAARQMRADRQEKRRRRQALSDLAQMKEDAEVIGERGMQALQMDMSVQKARMDEKEEDSSQRDESVSELPRRRRQASFKIIHGDQAN